MNTAEFISKLEVQIDPQLILAVHGYTEKRKPGQVILDVVDKAVEEAQKLVDPKALYQEFPIVQLTGDCVILESGTRFSIGREIGSLWQGSKTLGIALYTIGDRLEDRVTELLARGEHTDALNLDIAGTMALGVVGFHVQYHACERLAKHNLETGPWLNPGYLDWPLTDQRLIFDLMPAASIDVRLNDQCMMIPKKSVTVCSGIGIGQRIDSFNRCVHCGVAKCPYRKITVT
jgi:cobalamin-dependent methionine synthase I